MPAQMLQVISLDQASCLILPALFTWIRRRNGDEESALLLEGTIAPEEVSHCAAGVRWLSKAVKRL